jgi:hypothetical protein
MGPSITHGMRFGFVGATASLTHRAVSLAGYANQSCFHGFTLILLAQKRPIRMDDGGYLHRGRSRVGLLALASQHQVQSALQ